MFPQKKIKLSQIIISRKKYFLFVIYHFFKVNNALIKLNFGRLNNILIILIKFDCEFRKFTIFESLFLKKILERNFYSIWLS